MKKLKTLILTAAACGFLASCSSESVIYDRYSLIETLQSSAYDAAYDINLSLSDSLSDGGIVVKTSDVTLRSAANHRWSSALDQQLSLLFADSLDRYSVRKDLKFRVFVSKFYGSLDGNTFVSFEVEAIKKKKVYFKKVYEYSDYQEADGYPSLVTKLKQIFTSLSDKAASEISIKK